MSIRFHALFSPSVWGLLLFKNSGLIIEIYKDVKGRKSSPMTVLSVVR
jgi:hypothetical protein